MLGIAFRAADFLSFALIPDRSVPLIVLLLAGSYLLGSVPTGYLIASRKGIDLRSLGSGNIGATNVARALGKKMAVVTFFGDMLKGCIPVLVATFLDGGPVLTGMAGFIAFLGHCFPVFLKFRGGKGLATAFGVLVAITPVPSLLALAIWLTVFFTTRISSLSALVCLLVFPFLVAFLDDWSLLYLVLPLILFLLFNHRDNIRRLFRGTESRF